MRGPAPVMMCALLVVSLLFPSAAVAKGGNGKHSPAAPKASAKGKADAKRADSKRRKAERGQAGETRKGSARSKAATSRRNKSSQIAEKPSRKEQQQHKADKKPKREEPDAGKAPARQAPKAGDSERAQSRTYGPSETASPTAEPAPAAASSVGPQAGHGSVRDVGATGAETRGVLDTIRLKAALSLESLRSTAMWSAVTGWFGD